MKSFIFYIENLPTVTSAEEGNTTPLPQVCPSHITVVKLARKLAAHTQVLAAKLRVTLKGGRVAARGTVKKSWGFCPPSKNGQGKRNR